MWCSWGRKGRGANGSQQGATRSVKCSNHPTMMGVRRLAALVTSATKDRAQFHACCNGADISATLTSNPSFPFCPVKTRSCAPICASVPLRLLQVLLRTAYSR